MAISECSRFRKVHAMSTSFIRAFLLHADEEIQLSVSISFSLELSADYLPTSGRSI